MALVPGVGNAGIDTLCTTGTSVVFRRSGQDLWVSDGTAAGTSGCLRCFYLGADLTRCTGVQALFDEAFRRG